MTSKLTLTILIILSLILFIVIIDIKTDTFLLEAQTINAQHEK